MHATSGFVIHHSTKLSFSLQLSSVNRSNSPDTGGIDRPVWDEAHHRIEQSSSEKFALRMSGLNDLAQQPLSEKLKRFTQLAVAESQIVPFCVEKQETDRLIRSGAAHQVPKAKGTKHHPLYSDPWDVELALVKRYHREMERRSKDKHSAVSYQDALSTVPQVDYYPTTELSKMSSDHQKDMMYNLDRQSSPASSSSMSLQGSHKSQPQQPTATSVTAVDRPQNLLNFSYPMQFQRIISSSSNSQVSANRSTESMVNGSDDYGDGGESMALGGENHDSFADMERQAKAAMRAAKRGDTTALYHLHIGSKLPMVTMQSRTNSPQRDVTALDNGGGDWQESQN